MNRDDDRTGRYVLCWMQQSQRAVFNHALEFAVRRANELRLPVFVAFGLHDRPWHERPFYGKVRRMMASGLEWKCGINAYVEKVERYVVDAAGHR